ncbi:VWA-like domain-containing protein (plasmid) [Citricoccus nitrophenolicus]
MTTTANTAARTAPSRTTATLDEDKTFQGWRAEALSMMPYLAPTLFSFRLVSSPGLGTFAVDPGHRLYVDFDEVNSWGAEACAQVLLHECMHLLQGHADLSEVAGVKPEERKTWNLAGDAAINDDLRDAGCDYVAKTGFLPSAIGADDYQTALHYMEILRKKVAQQQKKQGQQSGAQGQGQPQQGQSDQSGQPQQGQDGQPDPNVPYKGCGSGSGGQGAPVELDQDDDMDGQAPAADAVEKRLIAVNTAAQIQDHVARKGIGSVPAGLREFASMTLAPTKTPWDRIMQSLVRKFVKKKQGMKELDFTRRHRRNLDTRLMRSDGTMGNRLVIPGWKAPIPTVRFYRDTSGSMAKGDLEAVSKEVMTIARRLGIRGNDLIVQDVDVEVYDAKRYTGAASLLEVTGRGGTDMRQALKHCWNLPKKERPAVVVVATDGGTGWPEHSGPVPVVVLLVQQEYSFGDVRSRIPSWAHVVEVPTEALKEVAA